MIMSNYPNYPIHRLVPKSCIICFEKDGQKSYSFTDLNYSQKKFLLESNYLDGARNIVVMFKSGKKYSFYKNDFLDWLKKTKI